MIPRLIKLTPGYNIKPFDCEDADLNGFLLETDHSIPNARHHAIELLAVTYLVEDMDADETIAYFSLLNDKIERDITVDALQTAQRFYEKCGFKILVTPEDHDETVLMCYDLKQFVAE